MSEFYERIPKRRGPCAAYGKDDRIETLRAGV